MDIRYDFSGRRFLITGASPTSTIGREIAHRLAESGASVTLVARNEGGLQEVKSSLPFSDRHVVSPYDLNDIEGIPEWMKGLAQANGAFDGLVHCAAVMSYSPLRSLSVADYEKSFRVNVGASLMLAKGFRQKGVHNNPGSIILLGSAAGMRGVKGRVLYASSKATQVAIVKTLSIELASDQIRINCIAPGVVEGPAAQSMFDMMTPEQNAAMQATHPLGYVKPFDVASAAAYLLSHEARIITGTVVAVDGGYTAL